MQFTKRMSIFLKGFLVWILCSFYLFANENPSIKYPYRTQIDRDFPVVSGILTKLHPHTHLIRVKITDVKGQYLYTDMNLKIYSEEYFLRNFSGKLTYCSGTVKGKSQNEILISLDDYKNCLLLQSLFTGSDIILSGESLAERIKEGDHIYEILKIKKHAYLAKKENLSKDISTYTQKVKNLETYYQTLQEQLSLEWRAKLRDLEEEHIKSMREINHIERTLSDLEIKIKIFERPLKEDDKWDWSLSLHQERQIQNYSQNRKMNNYQEPSPFKE